MNTITIECPLPDPAESPNSRKHWRVVAAAKAVSKHNGKMAAIPYSRSTWWNWKKVRYTVVFYHKVNRGRDDDNACASLKAIRDGIAEAWGMNDKTFKRTGEVEFKIDKNNPRVELTFSRTGD